MVIDIWHGTCNSFLFACRDGAYWRPQGIGRLVYAAQTIVLFLVCLLIGVIVRQRIRRKLMPPIYA